VARSTDPFVINSISPRHCLARWLRAAGFRITTVSLFRDARELGFDLFFTVGLSNVSAWEICVA
jgi:hypothetical protein